MESQIAKARVPSNSRSISTKVFLPFRRVRPRILYDFTRMPFVCVCGWFECFVFSVHHINSRLWSHGKKPKDIHIFFTISVRTPWDEEPEKSGCCGRGLCPALTP